MSELTSMVPLNLPGVVRVSLITRHLKGSFGMRNLRLLAFITALLGVASLARAADRVTCYTMWDDRFLYAAFEVQDPDLESKNTTHMSKPWEDDGIEIFIETDAKRAENRTANTYQMSVSPGGGSCWQVGGPDGQPKPKTIFTFKFAKKVQGTINNPFDTDIGYTIEVAIPWSEMGGAPQPGQVMGFNVLCRMKGENEGFVSLSPEVKTEADVQVPAKWIKIKFVNTPTIIAVQDGAVTCRKVVNQPPLINGTIGPGEWIRDMRFQVTKPLPTKSGKTQVPMERLSLTPYRYWYQSNARKETPFVGVTSAGAGFFALSDHPLDGAGPWFSYDQVQWHKDQLAGIEQAGIDVILPVYQGNVPAKGNGYAGKGLSCLVQAMKELKSEGKSFPLVGMYFDTNAMDIEYGQKPDLKSDEVKATFYGMIKDFFLRVPDEFRASLQIPADEGGKTGYVIALGSASAFSDFDDSFTKYCNDQFEKDFGSRLIWIGSLDYRSKVKTMDGYTQAGAGKGVIRDNTNGLDIATLGPGYDGVLTKAKADGEHSIRPRVDSASYKKDWGSLAEMPPGWVIIDGWNAFEEGSEIAPSVEYGNQFPFLTRINLLRFNGLRQYDAKWLRHDTPTTMLPGMMYQVTLAVKNVGAKPWYPGLQGVFLTARWFKDGSIFADTSIRLPIQAPVLVGQSMTKTAAVRTVDQDGKPLPDGDYELRWEMVRANDDWFTNNGDSPLSVPVKIGAPSGQSFSLVGSSLPAMLRSGTTCNLLLKVRNDGTEAWAAGTKVGYKIHKVSSHIGADSQEATELVGGNDSMATIAASVEPGRTVEVPVPVSMTGSDGKPLPAWAKTDPWTYVVAWEVNGAGAQVGRNSEAINVTSTDYGPRFLTNDIPEEMTAGKSYSVNLSLRNTGADPWAKGTMAVGYHWYYLDGTEAVWDGKQTSISSDVLVGQQVAVKASVTAPPFDGQYYLVWDVAVGDQWVSLSDNSCGGNTLKAPVNIVKGNLVAMDLTKLFDADVISFDVSVRDGDADGSGSTLPGELIPPLFTAVKGGILWPSGFLTKTDGEGLASSKHIAFKYPDKAAGAKNAIACKGQTIQVKSGKYSSVHFLVLAGQKVSGAEFAANYALAKATGQVDFAPWTEAPVSGMTTAFMCTHQHTPDGDQPKQACYLTDYAMPADPKSDLVSITLPNNPALKVMAITLEKAP